jgi:hypothetical protein
MTRWRLRRIPTHALTIGVLCLGATGCRSSGPPTAQPSQPPTTAAPPATTKATTTPTATATALPTTIQIGPGTEASYSVESQPEAGSCVYRSEGGRSLPDPVCTPGAVNPQVTQANIAATICQSGWTATVRPPVSVTRPEKVGSARAYRYTGSFLTGEYDHLIPLELGGDPNSPANLWLQPNDNPEATSTSNTKDGLEHTLNVLVCSGRLTLAVAQLAVATNWVAAAGTYQG